VRQEPMQRDASKVNLTVIDDVNVSLIL